jgi:hypothetical protein
MINLTAFLAEVDVDEYLQQRATEVGSPRPIHEAILLFSVLAVLTMALFLLAYIRYRKRRRGLARSPHPPSFSQSESRKNAASSQGGRRRRKWHRRRREHRPRNPTLAETGGLPPIRSEDQPPAPP